MAKTDDNLKAAFAGESQANRRYLAFAKAAEDEGLAPIAKLFRAAAEAETVHALGHLRAMGGVGGTKQNLQAAVEGETYEFTKMYPVFIEEATREKATEAARMMTWANQVEAIHAGLFKKALEAVAAGAKPAGGKIFVCSVCGNTVENEAPDRCPICNSVKKVFKEIA